MKPYERIDYNPALPIQARIKQSYEILKSWQSKRGFTYTVNKRVLLCVYVVYRKKNNHLTLSTAIMSQPEYLLHALELIF